MNVRVETYPAMGKPRPIDETEQAQRNAAVDYARGSVRLEGFVLAPEVEDLNRRYVAGELTSQQLTDAILALYPARDAERARRKAAVEYASGSVRLEGFEPSEYAKELDRHYIAGEITRTEKTAALLAHYRHGVPGTARVSRAIAGGTPAVPGAQPCMRTVD